MKGLTILMITSMLFFPDRMLYEKPEDYGLDYEEVTVATSDHIQIHGWFLQGQESSPVLLFFHGNAGNISGRLYKAKGWIDRGFSVFLIDYRGYGKSEGEIGHQNDLVLDVEAALSWLVEVKKVTLKELVVYGESLGSYPAIQVASKHKVGAIILEAPYTSFVDLADKHYPMIPGKELLLRDFTFANIDSIQMLQAPLFIMHGTEDETCPYVMSDQLFEKAPEPKTFFSIPNGAHNDLPIKAGEDYWNKPVEFLKNHLPSHG